MIYAIVVICFFILGIWINANKLDKRVERIENKLYNKENPNWYEWK